VKSPAVPVAIVGAGPYGLSIAAHLRAHGIEHRIFGTPMRSWLQHMPSTMFLKSVGFATNISDPAHTATLGTFCALDRREYADDVWPIPIRTFTDYAMWFQREHAPDVQPTDVTHVGLRDRQFELELASGERLTARRVVLAVGYQHFTHVPDALARLPSELVSHASAHRDFTNFAGRHVTVLGAGQSALESAALLHEAGADVRVLVRARTVRWHPQPNEPDRTLRARLRSPASGLGTDWLCYAWSNGPGLFHHLPPGARTAIVTRALGPAGAWWLKPRVIGQFPVATQTALLSAGRRGNRLELTVCGPDGHQHELMTDHLLAGTGYRVDLNRLEFLDARIATRIRQASGQPVLTPQFESTVPGLYAVGPVAAATFGPVMRFVYGADFATHRVVRHVARGLATSSRAAAAGSG
jgi:FAD-dependent urate hydroxylase